MSDYWIHKQIVIFDTIKDTYKCPRCNTTWETPTNYCPHCGKHMKEGDTNE